MIFQERDDGMLATVYQVAEGCQHAKQPSCTKSSTIVEAHLKKSTVLAKVNQVMSKAS